MTNKNDTSNIFNNARRLKLGEKEKAHLKNEFIAYMESYPASEKYQESRWVSFLASLRWLHSPAPYAAAFAFILIAGSGVTYAAQRALPGDFLYPVKVSVNEEVRGWFHNTPESYAIYEANRANERLEEIERLALRGRINATSLSELSQNVEDHIASVEEYVKTNENSGNIEDAHRVNTQLQSVLNVHGNVLDQVNRKLEEKGETLQKIIQDVAKQENETENLQNRLTRVLEESNSPRIRELATSTGQTSREKIAYIRDTLATQSEVFEALEEDHTQPITSRLDRAEQEYISGTTAYANQKYGKAFVHFTRVNQLTEEIGMLIESEEKLKLRIDDDNPDKTATTTRPDTKDREKTITNPPSRPTSTKSVEGRPIDKSGTDVKTDPSVKGTSSATKRSSGVSEPEKKPEVSTTSPLTIIKLPEDWFKTK